MYQAVADPYCYSGTTVLINRLGLRDQAKLDTYEAEMTAQRFREPFPHGRFSYHHYRAIHRHLFQDVYAWAGKIRTVRISKGDSAFCYPEYIDREMKKLFAGLKNRKCLLGLDAQTFANEAAQLLAELNAIHPFREGNGRTQLSFLVLLADHAGHPLNNKRLEPTKILEAMIVSFKGEQAPLERLISKLIFPSPRRQSKRRART
jgi:cell filamentation protein